MTVSVVIPARNARDTLGETIDSLQVQTHRDWEAIVVDDGSTDDTAALVRSRMARDGRIALLSDGRSPEGVSAARNRGIEAARGEWLLFLDADDWIDAGFLKKMLTPLERQPGARVAFSSSRRITAGGRAGPVWLSREIERAPFEVLARKCPVVIHGFVLDRRLIDEIGDFDASLRTCEDWDFWQRLARTGVTFHAVPDAIAFYRLGAQSLSRNAQQNLADARRVIDRGFAPDPRVRHPSLRHAQGANPGLGSREMAMGYFSLWCAAFDIGAGGTGHGIVHPLPDAPSDLTEGCRSAILLGLRAGQRCQPEEALRIDEPFAAAVDALIQDVEKAANQPNFAKVLAYALEPEISPDGPLAPPLIIGSTLLVRQPLDRIAAIEIPPAVDTLQLALLRGGRPAGSVEMPVFASLSRREVADLAIDAVSLSVFVKAAGLFHRPAFWAHLVVAAIAAAPTMVRDRYLKPLLKRIVHRAALASFGSANDTPNADALAAAVAITTEKTRASVPAPAHSHDDAIEKPVPNSAAGRSAHWEDFYRRPDPFACASPYEQLKYQRTLELLPPGLIARAVELGCGEGRFTTILAPKVSHLLAADISETALERTRVRCAGLANVDYRRIDFFDEPLPTGLDLLVCSETLYYLPSQEALQAMASRFAAALKPGGHLLCCHGRVLTDDPHRTAFDWGAPFGGEIIARTLTATPGLALERSQETVLYRIDLLRKLAAGESVPPAPQVESLDLGPLPETAAARSIVWGGAVLRRAEAQASEQTTRVPILNYHRIAFDGPASLARYRTTPDAFQAQMRWLRRHGYHSVSSGELADRLDNRRPFAGRPVLITFDDGYRDFHEVAWPILQTHDFTAEVFLPTDHVGGSAVWDGEHGSPAALMDWPEIQALAQAGVRFGSHMASHSHMNALGSRAILEEAARSRALIEGATGLPCDAIAAPFGETTDRFVRIAHGCGYRLGVTVEPGTARLDGDPLRLPRVEVRGDWSLEQFADALG